jgi:hypothetical protein
LTRAYVCKGGISVHQGQVVGSEPSERSGELKAPRKPLPYLLSIRSFAAVKGLPAIGPPHHGSAFDWFIIWHAA